MCLNRKTKRRKSSKGSTKAALVTTASPEECTPAATSGLSASGQPQIREGSSSVCDTAVLPGGGDDHQQGPTPSAKSPLADEQSGLSSYVGGSSTTEILPATAGHAAMEPTAAAGTGGVNLAPFSATSLKQVEQVENDDDGVAWGAGDLEPASASRGDHRHHEEMQRGASTKGKNSGDPDYGGRGESGEDATSEKFHGCNVAGAVAAALTVRLQTHWPYQHFHGVAPRVARSLPLATTFAAAKFLNLQLYSYFHNFR